MLPPTITTSIAILLYSIGEGDQLKLFLEKNTYIPPELMLVDDYKFAAYNSAGLGKIGERAALAVKGTRNMKPPKLKLKTWWSYLRNVGKLCVHQFLLTQCLQLLLHLCLLPKSLPYIYTLVTSYTYPGPPFQKI